MPSPYAYPPVSRRTALQVGSIGLLGLGMNHVAGLRGLAAYSGACSTAVHHLR
jgi:hypothetical protein